jgi:hypothetical protein
MFVGIVSYSSWREVLVIELMSSFLHYITLEVE